MTKLRLIAAVLVGAALLAACKGDSRTTTFVLGPDAGTAEGYVGGTPITLVDGTPVTLPNGTPVTSPEVKVKGGSSRTTRAGSTGGTTGSGSSGTGGGSTGTGGGSTGFGPGGSGGDNGTGFVQPTGTTVVTSKPNVYKLAKPKTGVYGFRQVITPDDGSPKETSDIFFNLTSPDANKLIRWQQSDASGAPTVSSFYEESHDSNGLFLTMSTIDTPDNKCNWSPKSAELPQSVIDKIGEEVTTESECTVILNGEEEGFVLKTEIISKSIEQLSIGGKVYDCIKVERNRVLQTNGAKETSTAHDWYAFELGIRIKTSDHVTRETTQGITAGTRDLTLSSIP